MTLTAQEILEVIKGAKEMGVNNITVDGMSVSFGREALTPEVMATNSTVVPDKTAEQLLNPMSPLDELSDEEILYYSTPYYDELQAKKEAHKKAIQDEPKENGHV